MKKWIILVFFLFGCKPDVNILEEDIEVNGVVDITEYYINASVDDNENSLSVDSVIRYYNDHADFDELYINVYPATNNELSFDISLFTINGVETAFERTGSVIHVLLDETLYEGETIEIGIDYTFEYWVGERLSNYNGDFVTMFFYPFVAYYDSEWHTDPYSFSGEAYYNDMGNYYVNLQIPDKYELATGGKVVKEEDVKDGTIYSIELMNARDYSFSISEDYKEYIDEINGIDVKIMSLRSLSDDEVYSVFDITRKMIEYTEENIGDYPYDTLTLEFGHIYGMESASIVYCSSDISLITLVHELYHQWFYGIIGNNQANEPWLDEGLTSFATGLFLNSHSEYDYLGYEYWYDTQHERYDGVREGYVGESVLRPVFEFDRDYGFLVYVYGHEVLNFYMMDSLDGDDELMLSILKTYYDEFKFEESSVAEFIDLVEDESGVFGTEEWFYEYLEGYQELNPLG